MADSEPPPQHQSTRCCAYPQGQMVIVPQLLSLMAFVSSAWVFPFLDYSDFGCFDTNDSARCFPLLLAHQEFWDVPDDRKGWAGAIQAGAFFGLIATALGFFAFALLSTATCFELDTRRLLTVSILIAVASICQIFTLIAGAANVCKGISGCVKEGFHVDTGGAFAIFAFFLYIAALVMTFLYYRTVRQQKRSVSHESENLISQQQQQPQSTESAAVPLGTVPTVTTVPLPGGGRRIERTYVDEAGNTVKEVTVEEAPEGPAGGNELVDDEDDRDYPIEFERQARR